MEPDDKIEAENAKVLIDILFKNYQEQCVQGRHHDTQRAAVVTATLAISGALIGLITGDKSLTPTDLPLTIFLIPLGVFAAVFSLKHYERFRRHMYLAENYQDAMDVLLPTHSQLTIFLKTLHKETCTEDDKTLSLLKDDGEFRQRKRFPYLIDLRLHCWWVAICLIVSFIGIILSGIIVIPLINSHCHFYIPSS